MIALNKVKQFLIENYNLKGSIEVLPGEIDANFKIETKHKNTYVLKISKPNSKDSYLDFQQSILQYLEKDNTILTPKLLPDVNGNIITTIKLDNGFNTSARLLSWIDGRLWSNVKPYSDTLRYSLGEICGKLTLALKDYNHEETHRVFPWDISQSLWTKDHIEIFKGFNKEIVSSFQSKFEHKKPSYDQLRKSLVHNDANDNNIIVSLDLKDPKVLALIDFGDAVFTQIINDVAIACTYAIMDQNDPLDAALPIIKGYHSKYELQEVELEHLYNAIAMRLVVSVTKSALNKIKEPNNTYLQISEESAWNLLKKWYKISPDFAHFSFRTACGYNAHPDSSKFEKWTSKQQFKITDLFPTAPSEVIKHIDLSVSSTWMGHEIEFNDLDYFQFKIQKLQAEFPDKVLAGGYLEPRPIYTSSAYDKIGNRGRESRTIHLGIDVWYPAYTPVHSLFDGEVITAVNDKGDKEYGGLVILKHNFEDFEFFTLYGHLTVSSATRHKTGDLIKKGDKIAELGDYPENGNWAPHLHFQVMMSLLDFKNDFPGVAYYNQIDVWKGICLNPNLLFNSKALENSEIFTDQDLISYRKEHLGKGLSLQYEKPLKMVRGAGVYLMDQYARKYLDTVNNVAHVGHEHPVVVTTGQKQMALINTNTRYLHDNIIKLTKLLLETLPAELSVVHFVNSGSEANELAIRMVKAVTGERDIIASQVGYHGNTNSCIDISSYKFDGEGGFGAPEHTHIFPIPDSFRGKYRGKKTGYKYAEEVKNCIQNIRNKGRGVGAFIIEPIISCGGQIELPEGFLSSAYEYVRNAGGLCISDEVQVGCGRVGKAFWGFQLHNVVPDIITIGKPLGNGHPLAAVVCTQEVANKFANGMEFFNTFGGNPVSCAIGTAVLQTIKNENLQNNALKVGEFLKTELIKLSKEFPIIGDVRGQGLFLGIELVDHKMNPLPSQTSYLINRMKDYGILMSSDGLDHNVLKIKPPMVFSLEHAKELIFYLKKVIEEDFMKNY